jgi:hypothetical protein
MLAAKKVALDRLKKCFPHENEAILNDKLVAYSSKQVTDFILITSINF